MQKTADSLEDLESRLEGWLVDIENKITEVNSRSEKATPSALNDRDLANIFDKLNSTETNLMDELAKLKEGLRDNTAKRERDSTTLMDRARVIFSEVIYRYTMRVEST